jgi:hypothetical protein
VRPCEVDKGGAVEVAISIDLLAEYGGGVDELQLQIFLLELLHSIEYV